jgi:hypothetical protein
MTTHPTHKIVTTGANICRTRCHCASLVRSTTKLSHACRCTVTPPPTNIPRQADKLNTSSHKTATNLQKLETGTATSQAANPHTSTRCCSKVRARTTSTSGNCHTQRMEHCSSKACSQPPCCQLGLLKLSASWHKQAWASTAANPNNRKSC